MSLGVSQISLIMQTKRKADIESQLSALALDRMSVTRESTAASEEYSKALSAKSLVWSEDGGTTTSAVSYSLFNKPTSNYILTNSNGAVVVSPSDKAMMAMLEKSGNGYKLKDETTAIIGAVAAAGYSVDSENIKDIIATKVSSGDAIGDTDFTLSYKTSDVFKELSNSSYNLPNDSGNWNKNGSKFATCTFNGTGTGSSNYVFCQDVSGMTESKLRQDLGTAVDKVTGNVALALENVIKNSFTDSSGNSLYSSIKSEITTALGYAETATKLYYQKDYDYRQKQTAALIGEGEVTSSKEGVGSYFDDDNNWFRTNGAGMDESMSKSTAVNGMLINYQGGQSEAYIDTTDVAKTFMYFFNQECAVLGGVKGADSTDYTKADSMDSYKGTDLYKTVSSNFGSKNNAYTEQQKIFGRSDLELKNYGGTNDGSNSINGKPLEKYTTSATSAVQYYYDLYEKMSINNFVVSDSVDNVAYLQQQILNGNLFVKTLSSDDAQTVDGANSPLSEKESDTTIAKAKAEYDKKKSEIEEKEQAYDVKQNQLDTELSSLNTMIESTQKMVDKDVEVFKMFNNA